MKKYLLIVLAGVIFAFLLYVFGFMTALKYIGFGSLILGIVLSGTLVSGDRMRANAQSDPGYSKNLYLQVISFSLPFLLFHFLA